MRTRFFTIFVAVFSFHIAGLSYFIYQKPVPLSLKPPNKKVAVRTVQLKKEKAQKVVAVAAKPAPQPKPVAVVETKPAPKPKPIAKQAPKSKPKPKEVAKAPPKKDTKKEKLLEEATKNLQAISLTPTKGEIKVAKVSLPESNVSDTLSKQLKEKVVLPEFGDVKVKLVLSKNGKVVKVEVLESESNKNANLVKKVLGESTFLPFGNHFGGENERSFVIVLSNDI